MKTEEELIAKTNLILGKTFQQLASALAFTIPEDADKRKGFVGAMLESALGTTAGTKPIPDFEELDIELKTIPINHNGVPRESTFVTSISLTNIHKESFKTSTCFAKLKRVLWVPIEGDKKIPFKQRRIGKAFLWSPSKADEQILQEDWESLTLLITLGKLDEIDATQGKYLQVRPKGANAKSLCDGYDREGNIIKTLPRGFYLRSKFTKVILQEGYDQVENGL